MAKKKKQPAAGKPVSPTVVWLAAIASTLVVILLYFGFYWLDYQSTATISEAPVAESELNGSEWIIFSVILGAFVLGPGILVALIVLPIIRNNKKK